VPLHEDDLLAGAHALLGFRSSDLDWRGAVAHHPELLGGPVGQVDRAAGDVGSPVVDSYEHMPPVVQVYDLDTRAERKRRMCSGPGIHVVGLAAGAGAAMVPRAIPGRHVPGWARRLECAAREEHEPDEGWDAGRWLHPLGFSRTMWSNVHAAGTLSR